VIARSWIAPRRRVWGHERRIDDVSDTSDVPLIATYWCAAIFVFGPSPYSPVRKAAPGADGCDGGSSSRGLAERRCGHLRHARSSRPFQRLDINPDRVPALVAELVRRRAAVIYAFGGAVTVPAAKAGTTTIPIVFSTGADPVQTGMVASFNRPEATSPVSAP
jgi:hypothetical protein